MRFSPAELGDVAVLRGLPDAHVAWFAEHGERIDLAPSEHMFERGQPADFMFIVVGGTIEGYEEIGGELLLVATTGPGQVTGMLPFSRMTHYPRFTVAIEPSQVLRVRKEHFPAMLAVSYEVGRRLVAEMSDRVRGDVRLEQQQARMAALGRLSAGLAHELNNPAAAAGRAAAALSDDLSGLSKLVMNLARKDGRDAHVVAIEHLYGLTRERAGNLASTLVRSRHEEELGAWLEEREIPTAWEVAGTFADAGIVVDDLEQFFADVPEALLADALGWTASHLSLQRIASEIASACDRISQLVGSVKAYSHMDRSPEHKPTDVREGIDNTLTLLGHKMKRKQIRLVREFADDLPEVSGNAGELNQVWTNLIDNAVDAVEEGGEVRIGVVGSGPAVDVTITDNGHGIPPDLLNRIFEPFFTTKGVGQGTGLGLDIARRIVRAHRGSLSLRSRAGWTEALVRLPASQEPG